MCVVSTNVAETSITIPGLKYVVDSGKEKTRVFSKNGGLSTFEVIWCSKSSANQRAGRCGRTEGGHCYRLYSSAVFDHEFKNFSVPEIQRVPVDDVALGLNRVVTFPFPSPPDQDALKAAERRLVWLEALEKPDESDKSITYLMEVPFISVFSTLNTPFGVLPVIMRGCDLFNLIDDKGFLFLNDGTPTHSFSVTILERPLMSPLLAPDIYPNCNWSVLDNIGSDHLTVLIEFNKRQSVAYSKKK
ncbi:probable ATP-dependent RNA helicase kurz [Caerostris extrusa]|uniref:Probable ATP-dependent RNA helicase kurz n=1 Tax=Caerostris extrusa TaxID=172846 RepID=A0AAV4RBM9_CAEEX|nr:probable ATP-dependent RNA helicase kurz [Caerostris extrusa]